MKECLNETNPKCFIDSFVIFNLCSFFSEVIETTAEVSDVYSSEFE